MKKNKQALGENKKSTLKTMWKFRHIYLFLIPAIIWFCIFCYYPMYGLLMAFKDYKYSLGILNSPFVGTKWIENVLSDSQFYSVMVNTVKITLLKLVICFPAPIIFALLLNEIKSVRYKKVIQTISYLPYFISWVIVAQLITKLLSPYNGLLNEVRQLFDPSVKGIFFLGEVKYFYPIVVLSDIWKNIGWNSIIYIAAITGIDPTLYEAAEIDGAGRFRKMWNITLPCIRTTIAILLVMSMAGILNAGFDQVYLLQQPSTIRVAEIIDTYVLKRGIRMAQFEYATVIGMFKSVISLVVVVVVNKTVKKLSEVSLW